MAAEQKPTSGGGLTLYAHLIGGSNTTVPGQISSAPVMYNQSSESQEPSNDAAPAKSTDFTKQLFQQRSKRPQQAKTKGPPKIPGFAHATSSGTGASSSPDKGAAANPPAPAVGPVTTTTAADWMSREEDDLEYLEYKPTKRNKKKKKRQEDTTIEIDWHEPYDPTQPTDYTLYVDSQEYRDADDEWFDKLYAHTSSDRGLTKQSEADDVEAYAKRHRNFAPPSNLNETAPPAEDMDTSDGPVPGRHSGMAAIPLEDDGDEYRPSMGFHANKALEDDPWARRAAITQSSQPSAQFAPPPSYDSTDMDATATHSTPETRSAPLLTVLNASHTISRAPVRFESAKPAQQDVENDVDMTTDDAPVEAPELEGGDEAPRSNRPGQFGFAKRLLLKHGWKEGQGLGASGTGMVKPLYVKLDKPKKFSDAEGGGFRKGGTGKIIGGKKAKGVVEDEDPHGKMSQVVVLLGLLNGVDVQNEMQAEVPLIQRIGEECEHKCGKVERIVCNEANGRIFIKFTNQLSALNAIQRYDGATLQTLDSINASGSVATARYYDGDDFARGVYDVFVKVATVE